MDYSVDKDSERRKLVKFPMLGVVIKKSVKGLTFNVLVFYISIAIPFTTMLYSGEMIISLPDNIDNFPIMSPQVGTVQVECYTGDNHSLEWVVNQYQNEDSLCNDTSNAPVDAECQGADWARETTTMRACYWKSLKKFHTTTNSYNFSHHGCRTNPNEPGGYGVQLMGGFTRRSDWAGNRKFILGNLEKLILSCDYSTDYFGHYGGCQEPCDPVTGTCEPIAFSKFEVITAQFDPTNPNWYTNWKGTQFYAVSLYDNRESQRSPTAEYLNCQLPTTGGAGSFVVAGQPVTYYGVPMAMPGDGVKHYEIDVLPRIKHYIQQCLGSVNFQEFRVDAVFPNYETYNTAILSCSFIDPKVIFVPKNTQLKGYLDPSPQEGSCVANGWVCDPDDYSSSVVVHLYEGSNFLGTATANLTREAAVGEQCGGDCKHGFQVQLYLPPGDHTIVARGQELDAFGEVTSQTTELTLSPRTISCDCSVYKKLLAKYNQMEPFADKNYDNKVNMIDFGMLVKK